MINNHDATVRAMVQYLIDNAPPGGERELARLKMSLEAGEVPTYVGVEFRPQDDVGCQLYVRVEGPGGQWNRSRIMDAEGNEWYAYKVRCEVSWASWGSADVSTCQRRLACMTATLRLAADIERAFPDTFHLLSRTAAQIAEDKIRAEENRAKQRIVDLVKKNARGLKVGAQRLVPNSVDGGSSFVPVGKVEVDDYYYNGKSFKFCAYVTSPDAFYFTRVA